MGRMSLETGFDVAFAAGAVLAAGAVAAAITQRARRRLLAAAATVLLAAGVSGWLAYALRRGHPRELAVAAGGLTVCGLVAVTSLVVARVLALAAATETHIAAARAQLGELVAREARERAAELERTLARARADSVSALAEEERRIADERRAAFVERERQLAANLTASLTEVQTQTANRLADWRADLERDAEASRQRLAELGTRQKKLFSEAQARLVADGDRLAAESEEQRTAVARLRSDLDVSLEEALSAARSDIEAHSAERRRALHELDERLRRREKEMMERIEREEVEATQRVRAEFEVVQQRQIEEMQRTVERATASYADDAAQQFGALVKSSREDAARRLARELDRAVETFAREAEAALAEKLAHVGDAGAQRLERRLAEAAKSLERQRDEWMAALDSRIADLESDVRRRLEELGADAEAERGIIEARLQELLRRATAASS
jgi:hypothetical protein